MKQTLIFGSGKFKTLGAISRDLGFTRVLLVSDRDMLTTPYVDQACKNLRAFGLSVEVFSNFSQNPDSAMVEAGRSFAEPLGIDSVIGLGGGSSMDCAKGINIVLNNGGTMPDYRGYGKLKKPLLPMIAVPTTAGTGSEAQSYTLISDSHTHAKMACGDHKLTFSVAVLDPELTFTQSYQATAASGYDAISHAVETWVTTRRTPLSSLLSREAWRLLSENYERVLQVPDDLSARTGMLLGAHFAGSAIEHSMLGATHACANPLTARYGTVHGVAIGLLLRHVVQWNASDSNGTALRYKELDRDLPEVLASFAKAARFPLGLQASGISPDDLNELAADAATQWTGTFNPRTFDVRGARSIYELAW